MPQIGELSPGLWLASGFGGHGLNTTALAGNIIARAIDEGDDTWKLFLPFELVWAGGALGRLAGLAYYTWVQAREQHLARQSRRREEEYRLSRKRQGTSESGSSRYPPKVGKHSNGSKALAPPATLASDSADAGPGPVAPPRFDWRDRLAPNRARVTGRE
jgi:hypothetical protein